MVTSTKLVVIAKVGAGFNKNEYITKTTAFNVLNNKLLPINANWSVFLECLINLLSQILKSFSTGWVS